MAKVLSGCPNLESLKIDKFSNFNRLEISSLKLRRLIIGSNKMWSPSYASCEARQGMGAREPLDTLSECTFSLRIPHSPTANSKLMDTRRVRGSDRYRSADCIWKVKMVCERVLGHSSLGSPSENTMHTLDDR
ncbi:hypothetical protein RND71_017567 [Anisodus tanguticus]|uniref:Uncharacterized protein n=1 Tax=Anisodus tanguticus TaxID=243964 RepID=A0AAE1S2J5_9SOLA|nr:hypothetical protein RND71_017567 [Anisodus tanguticus]